MYWYILRHKPLSPSFTLITILNFLSFTRAVDITLSVSFSPFARSISQTCTDIHSGVCCDGLGPAHLGSYWGGMRVTGLPLHAVVSAFHASILPDGSYHGGCSGPIIGQGFGPGRWSWGNSEGLPRQRRPLRGGMWVNRAHAMPPIEMSNRLWENSSFPDYLDNGVLEMWKRAQSSEAALPRVSPDVIVVDGDTYTDAGKEGIYRDEYGSSYTHQQIMEAAHMH